MGVFIALCTGRKPQMQETINNQQKILQIIHQGISTGIEILFSKAIVTIKPNGTAMQYIMPISITTIRKSCCHVAPSVIKRPRLCHFEKMSKQINYEEELQNIPKLLLEVSPPIQSMLIR